MNKEYKQEIIDFINENNLNDIFTIEDTFYDEYGCHLYVYLRVSTEGQDFGRQIIELYNYAKEKGIKICINCIYCDKFTGKTISRKEYNKVRNLLKEKDYLLTTNLNRIGRDYEGIKKEWYYFKYKDIKILISDKEVNEYISSPLPFEDKEVTLNRLFLQDLIFTNTIYKDCLKILEVSNSTKSGMLKAKLNGTKTGNPIGKPKSEHNTKENFIKVIEYMLKNEVGQSKACLCCNFPTRSFKNILKKCYNKYNTKDYKEILENVKGDTIKWEQF